MNLYTLAHLSVALKLNDPVCIVKLMIRPIWMTQLTDTALLAGNTTASLGIIEPSRTCLLN